MLDVGGRAFQEFGPDDEERVPDGDDGEPLLDGPRSGLAELQLEVEYDRAVSTIDAALRAVGPGVEVTEEGIIQAFCSGKPEWLAESSGGPEGTR